jgi:acid phosphatase (class A)
MGTQARLTAMCFQDVLGPWFNEENLPQTLALLQKVNREGKHCCDRAKQHFGRRRPRFVDPRIKPFLEGLDEPCYPSGHAVQATVLATVLSELAPEHRAALMERAREVGWNRIPAGFHYPSDCIVGRVLGKAVAQAILANADFQEELAKARREFDEVKKHAQPARTSSRN